MYTKEQAANLRQAFWTAFGQYMAPIPSADGLKINWVNYKTGYKDVYFRMDADNRSAFIGIVLTHKDDGIQELYYEQFVELRSILESFLPEAWIWAPRDFDDYGRAISRIYTTLDEVSIFRREDWPALISFFKPRLIALDEFWSVAQYSFEPLRV